MGLTWLALMVLVGGTLPAIVRGFLPPLPRRVSGVTPQAVVVLGAGRRQRNGEFSLTTRGLRRLQLAARLAHEHGLPLGVSGGQRPADRGQQPTDDADDADDLVLLLLIFIIPFFLLALKQPQWLINSGG